MTYYSTVLINSNPIGWTRFQATNLNYAKRAAAYRERDWLKPNRTLVVGIEYKGRIKSMAIKSGCDAEWYDEQGGRTYNMNVVEFVAPGRTKEVPF